MSDEPRYEPIDDDLPPPDPDDSRPARPQIKKPSPPTPLPTGEGSKTERTIRIGFTLPDQLVERIKAVRAQAGLASEVASIVPLTSTFTIMDEPALRANLAAFEKSHLPLSLSLTRVEAIVRERQTYVAAWGVDAEAQFGKVYAALLEVLNLQAAARLPFEPMIIVESGVPAKQFPALIAAMQGNNAPLTWKIDRIEIR